MRKLLIVSLLVNLAGLAALVSVIQGRGGVAYVKAVLSKDPNANIDIKGVTREKIFEALPPAEGRPIVFLGDSLTFECEWFELFGRRAAIVNRGIGGDTSTGVLKRIGSVSALHPKAVFLMIGANDRQTLGLSPADTVANYRKIIAALLAVTPDVRIFVQSVLPSRIPRLNSWSDEVNRQIPGIADGVSTRFVDLRPAFAGEDRLLSGRFTYDGLHLNDIAYLQWKSQLQPIIAQLAAE